MDKRDAAVAAGDCVVHQLPHTGFIVRENGRNTLEKMVHGKARQPGFNERLHPGSSEVRADQTYTVQTAHAAVIGVIHVMPGDMAVDECDLTAHLFGSLFKGVQNQHKERMRKTASAFFLIDNPQTQRLLKTGLCLNVCIVLRDIAFIHSQSIKPPLMSNLVKQGNQSTHPDKVHRPG